MSASEERSTCERGGMGGFEHEMLLCINQFALTSGKISPQHKHHAVAVVRDAADYSVREVFPAYFAMRCRRTGADCENRVQKQHSLSGPVFQIRPPGHSHSEVVFDFLEYVFQGWWSRNTVGNGKGQAHSLAIAVVWVLSEYHYFNFVKRSEFKSPEYVLAGRENRHSGSFFGVEIFHQLGEVVFLKLRRQRSLPRFFNFYVHDSSIFTSSI